MCVCVCALTATEHAVNANALANKPSIGCFDFNLSLFEGGSPSEEQTCMSEDDYLFPNDFGSASSLGDFDLTPGCTDFCVPVNAIRSDTGCTAANGAPGALKVTEQADVIGVVGAGCSGPSVEAATVLGEMGVPMVSPSSTSARLSDVEKFPTFFRTAAGDDGQSKMLLDLAAGWGVKKGATIGTRDAFSQGFAEGIASFGPSVGIDIQAVELVCEDTDCAESYDEVYAAMERIKDTGVKVIFLTPHCINSRLIVEIMYKLDMTAENCYQIISADTASNDACWDLLSEESAYGFHDEFVPKEVALGFAGAMPRGGSGDVYKDFIGFWAEQDKCTFPGQIHNEGEFEVEKFSPEAYDAVLAIAVAIKNIREAGGEVTRAAVVEELDRDDFQFQGATGIVKFGGEFEPPIGDHDRPPIYDIVAFEGAWLTIGYWDPLETEPTNIFAPMIFPTGVLDPPACLTEE